MSLGKWMGMVLYTRGLVFGNLITFAPHAALRSISRTTAECMVLPSAPNTTGVTVLP